MILAYLGKQKEKAQDYIDLVKAHPIYIVLKTDLMRSLKQLFDQQTKTVCTNPNQMASMSELPKPVFILKGVKQDQAFGWQQQAERAGLEKPLLVMMTENNQNWPLFGLLDEINQEAQSLEIFEKLAAKLQKADRFRMNLDQDYGESYLMAARLLSMNAPAKLLQQAYEKLCSFDPDPADEDKAKEPDA